MAVYERSYRRYTGALTPTWSRFLILPRYAYEMSSRASCSWSSSRSASLMPFVGLLLIYLHHNLSALELPGPAAEELKTFLPIDTSFFFSGHVVPGRAVVPARAPRRAGPGLARPAQQRPAALPVAAVLAHRVRAGQDVGAADPALGDHLDPGPAALPLPGATSKAGLARRATCGSRCAIFVGSWVWILFLSLLALAVSAWVKWKPVARIALIVIFFVLMGFGRSDQRDRSDTWWGCCSRPGS